MNTEIKTEYGADQIQILEGLEAVQKKTGYVYWQYFIQRSASPCV